MTQILKEGRKTIIKTGSRIDTTNPAIYRVLQMTGFTKFMTIEHTP